MYNMYNMYKQKLRKYVTIISYHLYVCYVRLQNKARFIINPKRGFHAIFQKSVLHPLRQANLNNHNCNRCRIKLHLSRQRYIYHAKYHRKTKMVNSPGKKLKDSHLSRQRQIYHAKCQKKQLSWRIRIENEQLHPYGKTLVLVFEPVIERLMPM